MSAASPTGTDGTRSTGPRAPRTPRTDTASARKPGEEECGGSEVDRMLAEPLGLRERKKLKTRRALRAAAFRLFAEKGWDATTVDQIAAAAEVSPSTFFRYFPSKEDLVVTDDYDPLIERELLARPDDEPPFEAIRHALLVPLAAVVAADHDEMLLRLKLLRDVPALYARTKADLAHTHTLLMRVLEQRQQRRPADDPNRLDRLELRVISAAMLAAAGTATEEWAEGDGQEDFLTLLDRTLQALRRGFGTAPTGASDGSG